MCAPVGLGKYTHKRKEEKGHEREKNEGKYKFMKKEKEGRKEGREGDGEGSGRTRRRGGTRWRKNSFSSVICRSLLFHNSNATILRLTIT